MNHTTCCSNRGETRLPNRVLEIGTSSNSVRLLETNNCIGRYACLSHCWGGFQPLKTTTDSLEAHKSIIAWDTIPKTFQDAIKVARSFDLDYIWIDSLCIVQDDKADWIRESKEMCSIYENSQLTIAATSAPNPTAGLFLEDRTRHEICGTTSTGTDFQLIVCQVDLSHPNDISNMDESGCSWPLLKRAWVFQERMLSPRVLHFGKNEFIWECRQCTRCECETGGHNQLEDQKKAHHELLSQPTTANLVKLWQGLVETYSSLSLTFGSDKFPALSGLAQQMAKMRPQATYLAGLWSDSLETDLLWINPSTLYDLKPKPMPAEWQAPSWSWASFNARVVFPCGYYYGGSSQNELLQIFFTVSDARTDLATSDLTGQVKGGSIMITGPTFEPRFVDTLSLGNAWEDSFKEYRFRIAMSNSGQDINQEHRFDSQNQVKFDFPTNPLNRHGESPMSPGRIKCIRMARIRRSGSRIHEEEYSMMVEQVSSTTSFQRIGMVISQLSEEKPSFWAEGGVFETIRIV